MPALWTSWALLLLLGAQQCLAIREFGGHAKEFHRPVKRWGRRGQTEEKAFTLEQLGRAAFDPEFAVQHGDASTEDLGLEDTPSVVDEDEDVRRRLREIFPQLDLNRDGYIDAEELWHWHAENGRRASRRRNEREFNRTDTDKDGYISFKEYMAGINEEEEDLSLENVAEVANFEDWLGTIKTAFKLADRDGDDKLSRIEYYEFQNPEESLNERLKHHVLRQDVYLRDDDHDGVLDFDEFYHGYWSSFYLWEAQEEERWDDERDKERARRKFIWLDSSGDERLEADELRAAFNDLHPNEARYARLQSDHMMTMADSNHDRRLTLEECLENAHAFYGVTEPETDYSYHEEL